MSAYTAVSKAIAPVGDRAEVVSINGGAVGPDLAELGDYFWNVIPLVNFEAEVLIPFVEARRGSKNIALIFVDDPLGESVQKVLARAGAEGGRKAGRRTAGARAAPAVRFHRGERAPAHARTRSTSRRSARR